MILLCFAEQRALANFSAVLCTGNELSAGPENLPGSCASSSRCQYGAAGFGEEGMIDTLLSQDGL